MFYSRSLVFLQKYAYLCIIKEYQLMDKTLEILSLSII